MKKLIFLSLIGGVLLNINFALAQSTFSFKEKLHLLKKNDQYFSQSDRQPLKFINKDDKVIANVKTFISNKKDGPDTFYQIDTVLNYKKARFLNANDLKLNHSKLSGEMLLDGNRLFFYPNFESKEDSSYNDFIKNHIFFFDIPERSSIDIHFNSWHIGVVTLPIKAFLSSRSDSIRNNFILGTNLNLMLGKKWGTVRYYNSPGSREDKISTKSWSINAIAGITRVELDKFNTTPSFGTVKTYVSNISYGIAFGYQLNKLGLFIATGIDSPLSSIGKVWNFSNKPWLGLGLGIGFW